MLQLKDQRHVHKDGSDLLKMFLVKHSIVPRNVCVHTITELETWSMMETKIVANTYGRTNGHITLISV